MTTAKTLGAVLCLLLAIALVVDAFPEPSVTLSPGPYAVGEPLLLAVQGEPPAMRIMTPTNVYRYLGAPSEELAFTPEEAGEHAVILAEADGSVLLEQRFTVGAHATDVLTVIGTDGKEAPGLIRLDQVTLGDAQDPFTKTRLRQAKSGDLELLADGLDLELRGADTSSGTIMLGRTEKRGLAEPGIAVRDAYALTVSTANAGGTLTKLAAGDALVRCDTIDGTSCAGSWIPVADLVPGENYTVNATDGLYAETGVATINAEKPIYRPGEDAVLYMAVLDNKGFLTDADVTLDVAGPDGSSARYPGAGPLVRVRKGIYRAAHTSTLQGTYGLLVTATGEDVDMAMASSYDVRSSYAYDVLRSSPLAIDPWRGPFQNSLFITPHSVAGSAVTVTERLPADYEVVDAGGAVIGRSGAGTTLTWQAPTGTPLTYSVQAPLRSPDLSVLGPATVLGPAGAFDEARAWLLAVDPTETLDPIVHVNTEVAGTDLTATEVGDISTDNTAYVTFTKNTVLTVELSNVTNISLVASVESLNCSVTYTSQPYSPAATFRVDDAFGGNALGSTTLPASSGTDRTEPLNNLQNDPDFNIADLNTLSIYIRNNDGGSPQTISVDDVWCVVAYTELDVTPPTVALQEPAEAAYFPGGTIGFNYTPDDDFGIESCTLVIDGVLNQTNTTAITAGIANTITSTISEGAHTWNVNCSDGANTALANETRNFTVDLTDPGAFSLTSPANATVSSDLTPTFSWGATTETNFKNYTLQLDDNADFGSVSYQRNTYGTVANTTYTFLTVINSGTRYYWRVIAYDLSGRATTSSQVWEYVTDTVSPTAFDLVSPAASTVSADRTPLLDWSDTAETNFANYTVLFDNNSDFSSPEHAYYVTSGVTNSSYQVGAGEQLNPDTVFYWKVIAYDLAGHSRNSTSTRTYTTDNTGPSVTPEAPPADHTETVTNTLDFNYSVTDALSGVPSCELVVNGTVEQSDGPITEGATQTFTQFLANGAYEWWVNCTDTVGNEAEGAHRNLTVDVTTDTTPPLITLNYPANDDYLNTTGIAFNYTPQDSTGIANCSLYIDGALNDTDFAVENNVPNYFSPGTLGAGQHNWTVTCWDNATTPNLGTNGVYNFTIDLTLPDAFSLVAPPNQTRTRFPEVNLSWGQTSETSFANYTIQVDNNSDFSSVDYQGSEGTITSTNHTTTTLPDDVYYWRVVAYDLAGNNRFSTQTWQFEVHTQPPEFGTINESPSDPVEYNPTRAYNFTAQLDEPLVHTVLFENDFAGPLQNDTPTGNVTNGPGNYTFYYTTSGLGAGTYAYRWYANDSTGLSTNTSQFGYTITKNTTTVALLLDGAGANLTVNESDIVNLTAVLDWPATGNVRIHQGATLLVQNAGTATLLKNYTTPGVYSINASYLGSANYFGSWERWNLTVLDNADPVVTLITPLEGDTDPDGAVTYYYNVSDTNNVTNCTLYINGTENGTNPSPTKGVPLSFVRSYSSNQNLTWRVDCTDLSGRTGSSETRNLSIQINEFTNDLLPTACVEETSGGACSAANINASDANWEAHGNLQKNQFNYVNATIEPAGIPLGATILNVSLTWEKFQGTALGTFYLYWRNGSNWDLVCTQAFTSSTSASPDNVACDMSSLPSLSDLNDGSALRGGWDAGNIGGNIPYGTGYVSMSVTYQEDVSEPTVTLEEPGNGANIGAGNVTFNHTPSDLNLANCTLWGDFNGTFAPNQTKNLTDGLTSDVQNSFDPVSLGPGYYTWNVQCYDVADNMAFALQNYTLNITPPDLTVLSQTITLNDTTLREGENVTVFAVVYNDGLTEAQDVVVQFFRGDPDAGGEQINGNVTVASLAGLGNTTVNVSYLLLIGPNNIYVRVDPADGIAEADETNNQDNRTFHVDAYNTYYGSISANITLDGRTNASLYTHYAYQNATGNLFFVRAGTTVDFGSLLPLGRNTQDQNTSDDFSDADALLNMTGFNDSLYRRWSNGTDLPAAWTTMTVYGTDLAFVPVIDSDSTGNFVTGILWDASQDSGGTQYDTGDAEPLVFITQINQDAASDYGVSDYVAEVPVLLRSYDGQAATGITIYYEIT